jgi:HK97 family phage portal protein
MWPFSSKRQRHARQPNQVSALARKALQIFRSRNVDVTSGVDLPMTDNSAFVSVLRWCVRAISEPALNAAMKGEIKDDHPAMQLLRNPNPWMDEAALRSAITASLVVTGNCYILKVFGTSTVPTELWPLMPTEVTLQRDAVTGIPKNWLYRGKPYPLESIIHIKDGVDPNDMFLGWSGVQSILAEVATDSEATTYTEAILRNMGIPGMIISLKSNGEDGQGYEIDPEMGQTLKDWSKRAFSGKARGETVVVTVPIDVNMPQVSPDKMALDVIRRIPERRICAVIGIPPIVAGLGEDPKYDNYRAAREAAYESWAVPMWRIIERGLTKGLDGLMAGAVLQFDLSNVRALQEDADAIAERWGDLYERDLCTRNEARLKVGLEERPGEDNFASTGSTGRASTLRALRDKPRTNRRSSEAS